MKSTTSDLQSKLGKIALIGVGKMGEAILAGLINRADIAPSQITVAEPSEDRLKMLAEAYNVRGFVSGTRIEQPDTIILAVKPQVIKEVMLELSDALQDAAAAFPSEAVAPKRVISIAAGITTATVQHYFPKASVVRVMPNVALLAGAGMSAISGALGTEQEEATLVCELFSSMGKTVQVPEELIDAATAISGSGPAYFAYFVEALARGGVAAGLSAEVATTLAEQTLLGTASYLQQTQQSPKELMVAVASPGGTTEAALESFEANGLAPVIDKAIGAAICRAKELA